MGWHLLEYDNNKGFKCQKCDSWTLGGNLYSSHEGMRVCFLCHLEEVSGEMAERYSNIDRSELLPSLTDLDPLLENDIDGIMTDMDLPRLREPFKRPDGSKRGFL